MLSAKAVTNESGYTTNMSTTIGTSGHGDTSATYCKNFEYAVKKNFIGGKETDFHDMYDIRNLSLTAYDFLKNIGTKINHKIQILNVSLNGLKLNQSFSIVLKYKGVRVRVLMIKGDVAYLIDGSFVRNPISFIERRLKRNG